MQDSNHIINEVTSGDYRYGFVTDIDTEVIHRGLDEETVRIISAKKNEPEWLLEFRLKAFRHWQTLEMPTWPHLNIPPIDYQDIIYYAAPKKKEGPKSLDEVDPELLKTFDKLGIPLEEQKHLSGMAGGPADLPFVGRKKELFSVRSARLYNIIRTWCRNIWAAWLVIVIISSPP